MTKAFGGCDKEREAESRGRLMELRFTLTGRRIELNESRSIQRKQKKREEKKEDGVARICRNEGEKTARREEKS